MQTTKPQQTLLKQIIIQIKNKFKYLDWPMFIVLLSITIFGTYMVFTSSSNMASGSATSFFIKQLVWAGVCFSILLILFIINIKWQSTRVRHTVMWGTILLVLALLYARLWGPVISGARGWIPLGGGITIQPVEYFKTALILWLSYRFSDLIKRYDKIKLSLRSPKSPLKFKIWLIPLLGMGITVTMPDFGGGVILFLLAAIMLTMSGLPVIGIFSLLIISVLGLVFLPAILPVFSNIGLFTYQINRLHSYVNPWADLDSGHQLINSYYAISNGGLFGRGLGNSIQKTGYLPEPNTDFIMAVVGEELGAVTVLIVLAAFGFIIMRLIKFALLTDNFQFRLTLYGIAAYIAIQILINLGGVSGILPITGVTFPLISYGGSSMMSWGITFGIALNIISIIKYQEEKKGGVR